MNKLIRNILLIVLMFLLYICFLGIELDIFCNMSNCEDPH